jgi:acyl-CoA synthetase (AMP-forming)/AMP-acid ligase II
MTSLGDLLEGPGEEALVHLGEEYWTRAEVRVKADAVTARLSAAGVEAGHAVAVQLPDGVDLVATLFGVWWAGAVYVPVNPRSTADEVELVMAAVEPAAVVTADGVTARATDRHQEPDVALISFTSGTTGRPKPVLLRHSGVLTLMDGVLAKMGWTGRDPDKTPMPNLLPVSLSLWAGLYNLIFAFKVGAAVVLLSPFDTRRFADAVTRFGLRSTVLPPAAMAMLSDDETITDLTPLRFVRSITAPLSPLQAHRFKDRFGIAVLNCYGQTEIGGEIIGWNAEDSRQFGEEKLGAVGRPHEGVQVRVDDETGELQVVTPAFSAGYADGADLADRLTGDGWFRTGDVGRVDDEGFVWIEGRLSDMVNRGGLKVFPAEVEEVLRLHPSVTDAAVAGVPDDRLGEVPWAYVVSASGEFDPAALEAHCRAHLAPYKVPAGWTPLAELPRNEVGKVLLRELRPD